MTAKLFVGLFLFAALAGCDRAVCAQSLSPVDRRCLIAVQNGLMPYTVHGHAPAHMSLADRMAFYRVPAVSIAVIRKGRIAWARAYGVKRFGGPRVTPETPFQAGSISKSVLALGVLEMVNAGRISLDTDVNRYLTAWKVPRNSYTAIRCVTIRELLTHTAGVTDPGGDVPLHGAVPSLAQLINGLPPAKNGPLTVNALPGVTWAYSNGGYDVLGQLLIDVTREPLPAFMVHAVLRPLGMTSTSYAQPPLAAAALPHDSNGALYPDGPYTAPLGDGGLWSTPVDLARFAIAVQQALSGKRQTVLTARIAREMTTPAVEVNPLLFPGTQESYGLGFRLTGSGRETCFGHAGHNEGYECVFDAFPTGDGVAIMTNSDNGGKLYDEILQTIAHSYGWPQFQPKDRTLTAVDPKLLDRYVGCYQAGPYTEVKIARSGDRLACVFNESYSQELSPADKLHWLSDSGESYAFDLDKTGRAIELTYPWNGVATPAYRIDDVAASGVDARAAAKFRRQLPDSGTAAALRGLLQNLREGKPDDSRMTPGWADFLGRNVAALHAVFRAYGPLKSVTFLRVTGGYDDAYRADFANLSCAFRIGLTSDGKIYRLQQRLSLDNP